MPSSPFLHRADGVYIVLQSIWRSRTTVLFIDTLSGVITDATKLGDGPLYSWTVHATDNKNRFICSRSTPTTPWEVLLGSFDQDGTLEWKVLDKLMLSSLAEEALNDLIPSIIPITARSPTETLVIQSKTSTSGSGPKPVCVTIPHGGPHTTSTTAFVPGYAALALEGYTLNIPNYTGSMGFGQTHIRNLLGHCGSIDVEDVVTSVEELVRRGISEKGRQVVTGGSHGGFIAAHLIGQHPALFDAAILRNPVISAGEMAIGTDIPDWVYAEFGIPSTFDSDSLVSSAPTPDSFTSAPGSQTTPTPTPLSTTSPIMTPTTYHTLYAASPIAHVHNVTTPVLIFIGEDDLRVCPGQGIGFYHAIKGRAACRESARASGAKNETGEGDGKDRNGRERQQGIVEMLSFPGKTHSTDGVEAARVCWEATRDWFKAFAEGG
ncbi:Alpha/Beta hydrolase protein [Suillus lakei]|nr:Alpha/Beta hydrolase protein [Suillus lakei]